MTQAPRLEENPTAVQVIERPNESSKPSSFALRSARLELLADSEAMVDGNVVLCEKDGAEFLLVGVKGTILDKESKASIKLRQNRFEQEIFTDGQVKVEQFFPFSPNLRGRFMFHHKLSYTINVEGKIEDATYFIDGPGHAENYRKHVIPLHGSISSDGKLVHLVGNRSDGTLIVRESTLLVSTKYTNN